MRRAIPVVLVAFALGQLVLGVLLWAAPGFFHENVGPYGARNDHYMGDVASIYLALGVAVLVAVRQPRWRVPVLAFALLQYLLHSINHLIDIGEADPGWLGPANLVALVATAGVLAWMLVASARTESPP